MGSCLCSGDTDLGDDVAPLVPPHADPLRVVSVAVPSDNALRFLRLRELEGAYPYVSTGLLHDASGHWVAQRTGDDGCRVVDFYWRGGPTVNLFLRRRLPIGGITVLQTTVL